MLQDINIDSMIYEIRGKQVMLDSDLAKLYGCKNGTKSINLAVKRHINRFPERFMFKLTIEEISKLSSRFQFETLNKNNNMRGYNLKYLPYAFTEEGVAMLATVLKTEIAEQTSIAIMDAFVRLRKIVNNDLININNMLIRHDGEIKLLQESFDKLGEKQKINHIFFSGQIYDAYSLLVDILNTSKEEIIIIDNYIDKTILDIISLLEKKVIIVTNKYNNIDIEKYKKQYSNLEIIIDDTFHDRFIIIDRKMLYHSGASFKDLGNKCFAISKINDNEYIETLLKKLV